MYYWKMPHVKSLLHLGPKVLSQHTISTETLDWTLRCIETSRSTAFSKYNSVRTKNKTQFVQNSMPFSNHFVWAARKMEDGKKLTLTQNQLVIGYGKLPTTVFKHIESDEAWLKIEFWEVRGSKNTLGIPKNPEPKTHLEFAECKHILMRKCTNFSDWTLFHRFWLSARINPQENHNTLSHKIGSHRTTKDIDGLRQSVFAKSLLLSQVNDWGTQSRTIQYYISEVYPVL